MTEKTAHRTSGINNSTSKHIFQFSKSSRFPNSKQYNSRSCYEHKTQFKSEEFAPRAGFGSANRRFGCLGIGNATDKNGSPSGGNYYKANFSGQVGRIMPHDKNDLKNKTQSYSFGVGRESMNKLYVDQIIKNTNGYVNVPGSGTYEHKHGFGGSSHNETTCYSMRKKLYMDDLGLDKSKKLPGPGQYAHPDVLGSKVHNSTVITESKFSVPKANDRFRTGKFDIPAPGHYAPKNSLNENFNSRHNYAGATRIGNNNLTFEHTEWKMKEKKHGPGPGAYARFSDFGGLEKVEAVVQVQPTEKRK